MYVPNCFFSCRCNTMMGKHTSVSAKILEEFPGAIVQKCVCHSLHLVASEACKQLPRRCEDLARDIYNYFKCSDKRRSEFKEFQVFCEVEPHRILRPSQTRWLSLLEVVKRINEQWQPLTLFFRGKRLDAQLISVDHILQSLEDPQVKMYFAFLEWVLGHIVSVNVYFQSEKVVIAESHLKMVSLFKTLLKSYMSPTYADSTAPENIDPSREDSFINLNNIYAGVKVFTLLQANQNDALKQDFLTRCRNFLITACKQIKLRYDFSSRLYAVIENLTPKNTLSANRTASLFEIMKLLVPRIIDMENDTILSQTIDNEWRSIPFHATKLRPYAEEDVDTFWFRLKDMKDGNGENLFKNVASFALNVLSIPHYNATCERVFSKVNLIKSKIRNKLITSTVNGLLLSSQCINEEENCVKFEPNTKMISYAQNAEKLYKNFEKYGGEENDNVNDIIIE